MFVSSQYLETLLRRHFLSQVQGLRTAGRHKSLQSDGTSARGLPGQLPLGSHPEQVVPGGPALLGGGSSISAPTCAEAPGFAF